MKRAGFRVLLIGLAALSISSAASQIPVEVRHAPDGGTKTIITSIFIPPLPNAPFTATVNTEWTRRLDDGTTIVLKNHRTVARDSAGRIFEERRALTADGDRHQTRITQLEFSDPSSHEKYVCNPAERVCVLQNYFTPTSIVPAHAPAPGSQGPAIRSEDLGHDYIGNLDTIGTRETTTFAPGAMGNDHPIALVKEFWFSPQLGVNLVVHRVDPRSGAEDFRVTNIGLGEPDPKMFDPPGDFRVVDARKPAAQ